ncbi:zinc ABC transporter substrate-binding protein ZnuA [Utexia brackfieldae]|uniref:zinc ABC transporter substrate-binding protein ZnuA n=1 Tax=Utexia brackfieldae TaxID=3074108 RepID=UPI00370D5BFE
MCIYSLISLFKIRKNRRWLLVVGLLSGFNSSLFTAQASILTSVKPIAFISQAIANNVTDTTVLLPDGASPHVYALKPFDIQKLRTADLVIWVGEDMETFLPNVLRSVDKNKQIQLMTVPAIASLIYRDTHSQTRILPEEDEEYDHHHHHDIDSHIWMSPAIAEQIAITIHDKLVQQYPDKKLIIDLNLANFLAKLADEKQVIAKKLINVQNSGYFVFHDGYGYFERQFGLNNLGHFTINPDIQPGAQKVYLIRRQLIDNKAVCVFKEPQFSPAIIDKVVEGTNVQIGTLDPLGMSIAVSPDAYFEFLTNLTNQYEECLSRK